MHIFFLGSTTPMYVDPLCGFALLTLWRGLLAPVTKGMLGRSNHIACLNLEASAALKYDRWAHTCMRKSEGRTAATQIQKNYDTSYRTCEYNTVSIIGFFHTSIDTAESHHLTCFSESSRNLPTSHYHHYHTQITLPWIKKADPRGPNVCLWNTDR